jgi:8-oxo-dGTP pyrophosphatase MutT (NUDIX family)
MGKRHDAVQIDGAVAQAGAIPFRFRPDGELQVLLVTSRAGLWIIPKGHVEAGQSLDEAARVEAMEEAGVAGQIAHAEPIGRYDYEKYDTAYRVVIFALRVTRVMEQWPEKAVRQREWMSLDEAIRRVPYPALRDALESLDRLAHSA